MAINSMRHSFLCNNSSAWMPSSWPWAFWAFLLGLPRIWRLEIKLERHLCLRRLVKSWNWESLIFGILEMQLRLRAEVWVVEVEMQLFCLCVVQLRLGVDLWMSQLHLGVELWVVVVDMQLFCLWRLTAFSWVFASCPSSLSMTNVVEPPRWSSDWPENFGFDEQ